MEELKITTPEEYVRLRSQKLKVQSGAVFHVTAASPESMLCIVSLVPEEGLRTQESVMKFVMDNYDSLVKDVIQPNIISPKLTDDQLIFMDVVGILMFLLGVDRIESFPDGGDSTDA